MKKKRGFHSSVLVVMAVLMLALALGSAIYQPAFGASGTVTATSRAAVAADSKENEEGDGEDVEETEDGSEVDVERSITITFSLPSDTDEVPFGVDVAEWLTQHGVFTVTEDGEETTYTADETGFATFMAYFSDDAETPIVFHGESYPEAGETIEDLAWAELADEYEAEIELVDIEVEMAAIETESDDGVENDLLPLLPENATSEIALTDEAGEDAANQFVIDDGGYVEGLWLGVDEDGGTAAVTLTYATDEDGVLVFSSTIDDLEADGVFSDSTESDATNTYTVDAAGTCYVKLWDDFEVVDAGTGESMTLYEGQIVRLLVGVDEVGPSLEGVRLLDAGEDDSAEGVGNQTVEISNGSDEAVSLLLGVDGEIYVQVEDPVTDDDGDEVDSSGLQVNDDGEPEITVEASYVLSLDEGADAAELSPTVTVDDDGWVVIELDDGLYYLEDIIVTVMDNAGNELEVSLAEYGASLGVDAILVDVAAPQASDSTITLSGEGASEEHKSAGYYQDCVTVTIAVENEPLLDIYEAIYEATSGGEGIATIAYTDADGGEVVEGLTFERDSGSTSRWTAELTTPSDDGEPLEGEYTVELINYADYSEYEETLEEETFTIDCTKPVVDGLDLAVQDSESWGWVFALSGQTVSVTISDDGSGVDGDTAVIYISNDGEDASEDATSLEEDDGIFSFTLDEDGDCLTFEGTYVVVSDLAGNEAVVELSTLLPAEGEEADGDSLLTSSSVGTIVDLTDPVVEVALTSEDGGEAEGVLYDLDGDGTDETYYDEELTLTVTISEANFDLVAENDATRDVVALTCDGTEVTLQAGDFTNPSGDGLTWVATCTLEDDGDWTVCASCTDAAGRASGTTNDAFTIDTTVPVITVEFDNNDVKNGKYYNDERIATITITERYFDPDLVAMKVNGENRMWVEIEDEADAGGESYTHSFLIAFDEEGVYNLTVECDDPAGNTAESYSTDFVIDTTAPTFDELELSETSPYIWNWVFAQDGQTITVTVSDNLSGIDVSTGHADLSNGATESLDYDFSDGATSGSMSFTLTSDGERIRFAGSTITISDMAGNTTTISLSPDKDAEDGLVVNGVDNNLPDEDAVGFAVDNAAPVITATYDNNDVVNGIYYSQNRTITIVIEEANFDFIIENDPYRDIAVFTCDGTEITLQAEDFTNPSGDGLTWVATYTFEADGDWTVSISFTDAAGRESNVFTDAFTIDTTEPYIVVTFDNYDVENVMYYKATRTATIEVYERDFDSSLVTISTTASSGSAPSPSGWTETEEDVWTCTVYFGEETHYTLDVSCTDLAGNTAEPYSEGEFVIDMTLPELEISGVDDQTAYADEVMPTFTCSDLNFDSLGTYYELTGSNQGYVYISDTVETEREDGLDVAYPDFEHELDMDDVYTLYVCAVDLAGNTTEAEVTFSVNRFGSNYILVGSSAGINGSYLNEAQDVLVREINVSGLDTSKSHVELVQDSRVSTLSLEEDYTTEDDSANGSWSNTLYTFPAELFDDDGYYRILLTSEDTAGNLSQNTMDGKNETRDDTAEIAFAVDTTAPSAELITIDSGGVYLDPLLEVSADVHDNLEVEEASVTVDGEEVVSWDAEELEAGLCSFEIEGDGESHDIVLTSTDRAGNKTVASYDDVVIADNILDYILNTPEILNGIIAGAIAAVAIIALAVILYLRHRRNTAFERNPFGR